MTVIRAFVLNVVYLGPSARACGVVHPGGVEGDLLGVGGAAVQTRGQLRAPRHKIGVSTLWDLIVPGDPLRSVVILLQLRVGLPTPLISTLIRKVHRSRRRRY